MIAARIVEPCSKLAMARGLDPDTLRSTLGEVLGVERADEDDLYAAMGWLLPRQGRIEEAPANRHLGEGTLVHYDVSSTYFEGRRPPLARLGHSRDGKKGKLQVVFGVLTNAEGCPVAVEVFEGNTGDPKTVASQVHKLRERFNTKRLVLVGDRGMLTAARIRKNLRPAEGIEWITALPAPAIRKPVEGGAPQLSLFEDEDRAAAHRQRALVVAPARRSASHTAAPKAATTSTRKEGAIGRGSQPLSPRGARAPTRSSSRRRRRRAAPRSSLRSFPRDPDRLGGWFGRTRRGSDLLCRD